MIYLTLAIEFFKIGLFSIGGGMATLPFLMDLTTRYDWFTASELTNMVAISESTPGPVGVNMATYAGYSAAGVPGAVPAGETGVGVAALQSQLKLNTVDLPVSQFLQGELGVSHPVPFINPKYGAVCRRSRGTQQGGGQDQSAEGSKYMFHGVSSR